VTTAVDRVEVVGVPFNSAGKTDGVARAPQALRRAGLVEELIGTGLSVTDRGDLDLQPMTAERDAESHVIASATLLPMIQQVRGAVATSLEHGTFPLVLGGDCPVLLGCLAAAAAHGSPRVLFVDGHEDAWPPERSTTGEAADMELGWLLGTTTAQLPADLRRAIPTIAADDVIVLGARDGQELADAGIESIADHVRIVRPDVIADDPVAVAGEAIATLVERGPWWLHVDLDVLSTESLAAVDYQQAGGLDWPTLARLTTRAVAGPGLLGWSVTIYNPDLDPDGAGAQRIVKYLADVLGGRVGSDRPGRPASLRAHGPIG